MSNSLVSFPPFRLDVEEGRLWRGSTEVALRRKPFAILCYLALHPQRLVTQDELVREVWGNIAVSESAIRTQLYDLRRALGEGIIETVPGRGYRFLPQVTEESASPQNTSGSTGLPINSPASASTLLSASPNHAGSVTIGRNAELGALAFAHAHAAAGERQMVFIIGEPGIGKTTLLNAFLAGLKAPRALVVRGQCVEQNGHGEPYLPLLEGLGRLCESSDGAAVMAILSRWAPTWLLQMPGLVPDSELAVLQKRTAGATQDRMLRELCEALERLSAERPVVLTLEDLQWSDLSTINLVSMLGSRRAPARLLVIGTARQGDLLQPEHPLNTIYRELVAHGHAAVITTEALSTEQISLYLQQRFGKHQFPEALAAVVHRITGGTPLFMVSVLDDLVKQQLVDQSDGVWFMRGAIADIATRLPDNVRRLIDIQIDRLTAVEQRILEIGSVVGTRFTAGLVAAAQGTSADHVEEICDGLVRREHTLAALRPTAWPDGTTQSSYAFRHSLYQAVALERSPIGRRRVWHQKIAERLRAGYAERSAEVAAELALHFERANEWLTAAEFYAAAGVRAASQFAGLDATIRFKAGLELIKRVPASRERDLVELRLLTELAPRLIAQHLSDPPWSDVHARILTLAQSTGLGSPPWSALFGKWLSSFILGDLPSASAEAERLVALAEDWQDAEVIASAIGLQATASFFRGNLAEANLLLDKSLPSYRRILVEVTAGTIQLADPDRFFGASRGIHAMLLQLLGHPDQAGLAVERDLEESGSVKSPFALAMSFIQAANVRFWRREPDLVLAVAERASEVAVAHDIPMWGAEAKVMCAWAKLVVTKDRAHFRNVEAGVAERLTMGPRGRTFMGVVHGDACLVMGEVERGIAAIDDAIAFGKATGEGVFMAELHRIKGELLAKTDRAAANAGLTRAFELAQASSAKWFELRAALALARFWQSNGQSSEQSSEAMSRLATTFDWFTEGFACVDLTEARQTLDSSLRRLPPTRRRHA